MQELNDYGASLLSLATIEKAYEDYQKAALDARKFFSDKAKGKNVGERRTRKVMDKLWIIQKDLLGSRIVLCLNLISTKMTAEEMKKRYEDEHKDLFQPLEEKGLILRGDNRKEVQETFLSLY